MASANPVELCTHQLVHKVLSSVSPIPHHVLDPSTESSVRDSLAEENAAVEPHLEAAISSDPCDSMSAKAPVFPRDADLSSDPAEEFTSSVFDHPADKQIASDIALEAKVDGIYEPPAIGEESTFFHVIVEGVRVVDIEPDATSIQSQDADGEASVVQLIKAETSPAKVVTSSNIPNDVPYLEESVSYKVVVEGVSGIAANVHNLEMDNGSPSLTAGYGEPSETEPGLFAEVSMEDFSGVCSEDTEIGVSKFSLEVAQEKNQQGCNAEQTITAPTVVNLLPQTEESPPVASPGSGSQEYVETTNEELLAISRLIQETHVQGRTENISGLDQKTDPTHHGGYSSKEIQEINIMQEDVKGLSSSVVRQHDSGSLILEGSPDITSVSARIVMEKENNQLVSEEFSQSATSATDFIPEEDEAKIVLEDQSGTDQKIEVIQCEGSFEEGIPSIKPVSPEDLMENGNNRTVSKEFTESLSMGEVTKEVQAFETFIEPPTNGDNKGLNVDDAQHMIKEVLVSLAGELTIMAHELTVGSKVPIEIDSGGSPHPPTQEIVVEESLPLANKEVGHVQVPVTSHTIVEDDLIVSISSYDAKVGTVVQQLSVDDSISFLSPERIPNKDNRPIETNKGCNKVENSGAAVNNEAEVFAKLSDAMKPLCDATFVEEIADTEVEEVCQDDHACSQQSRSTFTGELLPQECFADYSFANIGEESNTQLIASVAIDDNGNGSHDHAFESVQISHRLMAISNNLILEPQDDQAEKFTECLSVGDEVNKTKESLYCPSSACVDDNLKEAYDYEDRSLKGSVPEAEVLNPVETVVAVKSFATSFVSGNLPVDGDNQNGQNSLVQQEPAQSSATFATSFVSGNLHINGDNQSGQNNLVQQEPAQSKEHPCGSVPCANGEKQFQSVENKHHVQGKDQKISKENGNVRRKERFNIGIKLPLLMTGIAIAAVAAASISRSNR